MADSLPPVPRETARQIAERLDDAADALDLGDKESPLGVQLVGEDVVNLSALIREGADTIAALTANLARLRTEGEALLGALESIARDCGDPAIEHRALSALAAPRAEDGTGR
jgi:hypothetical protein